jgi:hypothetical protein
MPVSDEDLAKQYGGTVASAADEAALAKQYGGTVASSDVLDSSGATYLYTTPEGTKVYGAEPYAQPQGTGLQRFGRGFWDYSLGGLGHLLTMIHNPLRLAARAMVPGSEERKFLTGLVQAHVDQAQKAKDAFDQGSYVEAMGHMLGTLPMIGPAAANIGETLGGTQPAFDKYGNVIRPGAQPDIPQAAGRVAGLATMTGASEVLPPAAEYAGQRIGFRSQLNPVQQEAMNYLVSQGVPVRAGIRTGSKLLQANEATAAHMPFAHQAAEEFELGTKQATGELAERLATEAHYAPATPYQAGKEVAGALEGQIADLNTQEQAAYKRAWRDAKNPRYAINMQVGTRTAPPSNILGPTGQPVTQAMEVPTYQSVQMPVDVRWMKDIAREEIPKYEYSLSASEQSQSKAFTIYKKILGGPDYISAEQAEEALKGLKAEARGADDPNVRNVAQGTAAGLIPRLQEGVDAAVAKTGPEAVQALRSGRNLHFNKMEVKELADKLREEPVQAFDQMSMAKDAGVDYLDAVAKRAPDMMPRLGRAYLDNLFDQATRKGAWDEAKQVWNKWKNLGERTKALMFPGVELRQALDRFFLGQEMTARPINPSGTALVRAAQEATVNPLKWAYGYVGSKLLFTPAGIRLLTRAIDNPPVSAADVAMLQSQAQRIAGPAKRRD